MTLDDFKQTCSYAGGISLHKDGGVYKFNHTSHLVVYWVNKAAIIQTRHATIGPISTKGTLLSYIKQLMKSETSDEGTTTPRKVL